MRIEHNNVLLNRFKWLKSLYVSGKKFIRGGRGGISCNKPQLYAKKNKNLKKGRKEKLNKIWNLEKK